MAWDGFGAGSAGNSRRARQEVNLRFAGLARLHPRVLAHNQRAALATGLKTHRHRGYLLARVAVSRAARAACTKDQAKAANRAPPGTSLRTCYGRIGHTASSMTDVKDLNSHFQPGPRWAGLLAGSGELEQSCDRALRPTRSEGSSGWIMMTGKRVRCRSMARVGTRLSVP